MPNWNAPRLPTYEELERAGLVNTDWQAHDPEGSGKAEYETRRGPLGAMEIKTSTPRAWEAANWPGSGHGVNAFYNPVSDVTVYRGEPRPDTVTHERLHHGQDVLTNYPLSHQAARSTPSLTDLMKPLDPEWSEWKTQTEMPAYRFETPIRSATTPVGSWKANQLADYLDAVRWANPDQSYNPLEVYMPEESMRTVLKWRGPIVNRPHVEMQEERSPLPWR